MAYADQEMSTRRIVTIGLVALLHAGVGYALVSGLASSAARKALEEVQAINLTPEAPPEEAPPPPPPDAPPPPPPEITRPPVQPNVIQPRSQPNAGLVINDKPAETHIEPKAEAKVEAKVEPKVEPKIDLPQKVPPTPMKPKGNPGGWVTESDYPSSARRAEEQGRVGFRLEIGPDGKPTSCTVTGSSGSGSLDSATCPLLMRRARFTPGKDDAGNPRGGVYSNSVRWQLTDN
jgi:periplasmic protein TonB